MDGKTIAKYEDLLFRICSNFELQDLKELSELLEFLRFTRQTDVAVACLRFAIYFQPNVQQLWMKLAEIYEIRGETGKAVEAYREFARLVSLDRATNDFYVGFSPKHDDILEAQFLNLR